MKQSTTCAVSSPDERRPRGVSVYGDLAAVFRPRRSTLVVAPREGPAPNAPPLADAVAAAMKSYGPQVAQQVDAYVRVLLLDMPSRSGGLAAIAGLGLVAKHPELRAQLVAVLGRYAVPGLPARMQMQAARYGVRWEA